jgi:hypothetical protein
MNQQLPLFASPERTRALERDRVRLRLAIRRAIRILQDPSEAPNRLPLAIAVLTEALNTLETRGTP